MIFCVKTRLTVFECVFQSLNLGHVDCPDGKWGRSVPVCATVSVYVM